VELKDPLAQRGTTGRVVAPCKVGPYRKRKVEEERGIDRTRRGWRDTEHFLGDSARDGQYDEQEGAIYEIC
jgi:hypothetical protein